MENVRKRLAYLFLILAVSSLIHFSYVKLTPLIWALIIGIVYLIGEIFVEKRDFSPYKKHKQNIILIYILIIIGVFLRLNRIFEFFDFYGRVYLEHFIAFFFFPVFTVTLGFLVIDFIHNNKGFFHKFVRKNGRKIKYWIIILALCINIFLTVFWEYEVQNFRTSSQILFDVIGTITSFVYLYSSYK